MPELHRIFIRDRQEAVGKYSMKGRSPGSPAKTTGWAPASSRLQFAEMTGPNVQPSYVTTVPDFRGPSPVSN